MAQIAHAVVDTSTVECESQLNNWQVISHHFCFFLFHTLETLWIFSFFPRLPHVSHVAIVTANIRCTLMALRNLMMAFEMA